MTDITAIGTRAGWLYLAGIVNVYSRRAIGYAMDTRRYKDLVETALHMALLSRRLQEGLLHRSDRGRKSHELGLPSHPPEPEYRTPHE